MVYKPFINRFTNQSQKVYKAFKNKYTRPLKIDIQYTYQPLKNVIQTIKNWYSETLNNEYIERIIHQMSYSSLSDNGILQIFSFLIK